MSLLLKAKVKQQLGRVLYITDKFGVSQGYEPAFTKMVHKAGIPRAKILKDSPYSQISELLKKYGNEKTLRFNPDKKDIITRWVDARIKATRPSVIVCSDPACLGLFTNWDIRSATIDKCRGGVYDYGGIPVIITLPITAIHRNVDERITRTLQQEGDDDDVAGDQVYQPYRVQSGAWILSQDWGKIARYLHGKQRRLPPFVYSVCRNRGDLEAAARWLLECECISVDIETACWPSQITCCGYTGIRKDGRVRGFVIPFYDPRKTDGCFWESEEDHVEAFLTMRRINESPALKVLQNGNYDASYFVRDNVGLENFLLDTMLMWYSMFMELPKSLDFISSVLIDSYQYWKDDIKGLDNKDEVTQFGLEKYWRYNCLDTYYTLFNALYLLRAFKDSPAIQWNYRDVFMRSRSGFSMSMRGIKADFNKLREHREALGREAKVAIERFRYTIADPTFNINSPDQKQEFLYNVLGATPRNARGRVCKANEKPSSGAVAIKQIKNDHPLFDYILRALEGAMVPDKQMSNITGRLDAEGKVKGGIRFLTDRLRTSYNAAGTETTRYSSKGSAFWDGTNLQNIRDKYRNFAVADEGCILIDVDYSQSDDFFMGFESEDKHKIEVLASGRDGHCVHGELFFKRPYDELVAGKNEIQPDGNKGAPWCVHPIYGIRQLSKKIVHAANFNMTPPTLYLVLMGKDATIAAMKYLGESKADTWNQSQLIEGGGLLLNAYRREYPRLTDRGYFRDLKEKLLLDAQLTNAFGITRRFIGDPKDSGTIREAAAFMGQSGTAGNMNRVQYEIDHGWIPPSFRDGSNQDAGETPRKMDLVSHGFRFLLQTHDSFTAELKLDHPRLHEAVNNLLYVMNRPVVIHGREVRVRTEATFGLRWGKNMIPYEPGEDNLDDVIARALAETW